MVHTTGTAVAPAAPPPPPHTKASGDAGSDDEWDVVNPTMAVLKPDAPTAAPGMEAETSKDRMSFILVGHTMAPGAMTAAATAPAAPAAPATATQPAGAISLPPPLAAGGKPNAADSPPTRPAVSPSPPPEVSPPSTERDPLAEALQRMRDSPALPGSLPNVALKVSPKPPAAVFQPPPPPKSDGRTLRCATTISMDEAVARQIVAREAEVERRDVVHEWRAERQRLGDREARATVEGDMRIARRLQREEEARLAEIEARRRADEERRSTEALAVQKRAAEHARAVAGPARKCDCLGASAGHHRAACPVAAGK